VGLTDRQIATLKTHVRINLSDDQVPGLVLRVTPNGGKTWALRYRPHPGTRDVPVELYTLGQYGPPPLLTLAAARKEAQKIRRRVDAGENPAAEKRTARVEAGRTGDTIDDLATDYIERHAKKHKRSWREDQRQLDADVLPAWKTRKVKELTRRDVRQLIERIADRGSPVMANRTLALVRKMLNFAVQRDWIEANPALLIEKPGAEKSRERVLTDDEIRQVWKACAAERPAMCALMKLRLVTAQRGGELAQLRWSDMENGWLTIPGTVTKNKLPHRVPLTETALKIVGEIPRLADCEWMFPGRPERQPLGDHKKAGQRITKRVISELQKADPTVEAFDFRGHDLRRTASTKMAAAGVSQTDIAKVLNHVEGGPRATHVYNRYAYDREKLAALTTWERVLTTILAAAANGNPAADSQATR
jgi:integrase